MNDAVTAAEGFLADMRDSEIRLAAKIDRAKASVIKWMIGVSIAQVLTIAAAVRLFPKYF